MGAKQRPISVPTDPALLGYLAGIVDGEAISGLVGHLSEANRGTGPSLFAW